MKRLMFAFVFILASMTVTFGQYSNPTEMQNTQVWSFINATPTTPDTLYGVAATTTRLNDLSRTGTYNGTAIAYYTVVIDAASSTDTFKWKKNAGSYTTGVSITGSAQTLSDNISVTFGATTGHALNDQWIISVTPTARWYFNGSGDLIVTSSVAGPFTISNTTSVATVIAGGTLPAAFTTVTASVGVQSAAVARTATADGTGTGTIAAGTRFVAVTSASANNIIILPVPVVGNSVTLAVAATGYELRSSTPTTIAINGGTGSAAESAIGANVVTTCNCTSSTTWICMDQSSAGVITATEVAAP